MKAISDVKMNEIIQELLARATPTGDYQIHNEDDMHALIGEIADAMEVGQVKKVKISDPNEVFTSYQTKCCIAMLYKFEYTATMPFYQQGGYGLGVLLYDGFDIWARFAFKGIQEETGEWGDWIFFRDFETTQLITRRYLLQAMPQEGEANGWKYRKWQNGDFECWRNYSENGTRDATGSALFPEKNLYYCFFDLPFEAVDKPPHIFVTMRTDSNEMLHGVAPSLGTNQQFTVLSTYETSTRKINADIYVIGRWVEE